MLCEFFPVGILHHWGDILFGLGPPSGDPVENFVGFSKGYGNVLNQTIRVCWGPASS
jgi:hypothetical protein